MCQINEWNRVRLGRKGMCRKLVTRCDAGEIGDGGGIDRGGW